MLLFTKIKREIKERQNPSQAGLICGILPNKKVLKKFKVTCAKRSKVKVVPMRRDGKVLGLYDLHLLVHPPPGEHGGVVQLPNGVFWLCILMASW